MRAMGIEDGGEEEKNSTGEKETARRQTLKRRTEKKKKTDNKCEEEPERREWEDEGNTSALTLEGSASLAQIVCLSVCVNVVVKWNCCGCAWLLQSVFL